MRGAAFAWVALFAILLAACGRTPPDATPEGTVRLWIERMEAAIDDPRMMREAYGLLGPATRGNLEERARRATQAQGRRFEPFEMLAEGRFGLRFRPKTMKASVVGDRATGIEVASETTRPSTRRACGACTRPRAGASSRTFRSSWCRRAVTAAPRRAVTAAPRCPSTAFSKRSKKRWSSRNRRVWLCRRGSVNPARPGREQR